jgi:hypothetical protein
VAKKGVDYKISPRRAALSNVRGEVPKLSPVAYQIQGYKLNRAIFNPTAARLGQAIAGEMSLDDALKAIAADVRRAGKAANSQLARTRVREYFVVGRIIAIPIPGSGSRAGRTLRGSRRRLFSSTCVDARMRALQRVARRAADRLVFVAPNLLILALFTFLPIVINFCVSRSPAARALSGQRPYVGGENFATLFECTNYLDPSTCRKDLFWRSIYNTAFAVVPGRS